MTLQTDFLRANLVKAVCSNAVKQCEYRKITVRPVESGGRRLFRRKNLPKQRLSTKILPLPKRKGGCKKM